MWSLRGILLCAVVSLVTPLGAAEPEFVHVTRNTLPNLTKEITVSGETIGTLGKITVTLHLSEPRIVSMSLELADGASATSLSTVSGKTATYAFVIPDWNLDQSKLTVAVGDPSKGEAESFVKGKFYIVDVSQFVDLKVAERRVPTDKDKGIRISGESQRISGLLAGVGEADDRKISVKERMQQIRKVVYATQDAAKFFNVHGNSFGLDMSRTIVFQGKQGAVKVRPGTAVLVELPRLTKTLKWDAGDAPEILGDDELPVGFDHVLCWWETNGKIFWECYGPKPFPKQ